MHTPPKVTKEQVEASILDEAFILMPNGRTTVCQLTLFDNGDTGFTVEGLSACVSKALYSEELGNQYSRQRAFDEAWKMQGFLLAYKLDIIQKSGPARLTHPEGHTYVGTKAVYAYPMTLGEYNEYRGWQIPANEDPARAGYLVEYLDSDGYLSWSPKDVFERSYFTLDYVPTPESHVDRMKKELVQLSQRVAKLQTFTRSDVFDGLDPAEREDMHNQRIAMEAYLSALSSRVARVSQPTTTP